MSNDNAPIPNTLLREAATQTAFSLTLTRNHIYVLDSIAHGTRGSPADRIWVPTVHGLHRRGLTMHFSDPNSWTGGAHPEGHPDKSISHYYRLTPAGWLMHDLLAAAGLVERVSNRKQRKLVI